ncbi:hypothetical protein HPB47_026621 [Ixodes persulcatus]|uniref:Uncharacterized protein n=1 Tax=Ixodes persulcatus TaxID=34615 RepID=A0AC60Q040_IXOPE|nr:hypothetical protein HPB47_026621 [Ixodes persulcatus]
MVKNVSASALDSASEASDLTDSSASAREKARKKVSRRRRGQPDRWPRLLVLSVEAGTVVECQLESSKGKTVTFKFDIHDMFPRDIANNLVVTNLLAEQHADVFVEQVQDIVQQLKEHPDRLPTVSHHLAVSDGRLSFENMEGGSVMVMPGRLEKESSEPPGSSQGSPVRQVKPLPTQLHQSATSRQVPSPIDEQLPPLPAPHAAPAAASASASHSVPATPTATASPVPIAVVQPPTPVSKSATSQAAAAAAGAANQVTAEAAADSSSSSSRLASPSATGDERQPLASAASAQPPPHAAGSAAGLATSGLAVSVLPAGAAVASAPAPVPTVDMRQLQAPLESGGSQAPTPPIYGTTPHALSSENSFSESEPGSSAMPPQAYGIVTDLSHLQQRLVELTTTSGGPTHATVTVPAATLAAGCSYGRLVCGFNSRARLCQLCLRSQAPCAPPPATVEHAVAVPPLPETPSTPTPPSPKQPATSAPPAPVTAAAVLATAVPATATTATTSVAGSSSRPSSVPPEPRKPAVATNLEDLKLELQKLHGNTMKSNIEQGLQAIFSQNTVSSAQPLTPAHSQPQVLPVLDLSLKHRPARRRIAFPGRRPAPGPLGEAPACIAVQVVPATPVVTAHSAGQVSAEGGTHIPLASIAVPCGNLPAPATVVPVPPTHEPVATGGSPDGIPGLAVPAAPQAGNRFSRFHVTPVRDDPLLSNPSSASSSSSTTTQSTPASSSNTVVPPTPPPDAPAPPALATTATSPIPLSPDTSRGSSAEVSRGGGGGCVVSTATQTSSTEVKASPPVNCGRFKVTTVVDELAARPPISAVTPMPSVAEGLELKSALTTEQRQELEVEESEDAEEFLKQLLARQQREREELENRHRRELELVRQRLRNAGGSPAWALCETTANWRVAAPSGRCPHSQSVPHFPPNTAPGVARPAPRQNLCGSTSTARPRRAPIRVRSEGRLPDPKRSPTTSYDWCNSTVQRVPAPDRLAQRGSPPCTS